LQRGDVNHYPYFLLKTIILTILQFQNMRKLKFLWTICALTFIMGVSDAWASKTVYLAPGPWATAGALFTIWGWPNGSSGAWYNMSDSDSDGIYEASLPDNVDYFKFERMNPADDGAHINDWDYKWTESGQFDAVDGYLFTILELKDSPNTNISPYELNEEATYYLYNVGAAKFLCSGNAWGSHASVGEGGIPIKLTPYSGTYKLSTSSIYSGKYVHRTSDATSVFMDSGDITYWAFERVSDNTYKIKDNDNKAKFLIWNNGDTYVYNNSDPGTTASQWKLYTEAERIADLANATKNSSKDATFLIKNYYFAYGTGMIVAKDADLSSSPSWKGTSLTNLAGCHTWESQVSYSAEQYEKTFDNYQELTVPNGKYHMTAKVLYRTKENYTAIPYIYATTGGNTVTCNAKLKGDGVTDLSTAAQALMGDDYLLDGVDIVVNNGSLQVGVKSDANVDWTVFDDFSLTYYGPVVENLAVALPGSGDMAADTWYYLDVATTGIYAFSATTLSDIVYTTDGTAFGSDVDTALPTNILNSASTRYYVKSSSANNLSVSKVCDNYSYWFLRTSDYKYLSRGGSYNTQAVVDSYGIPVRIAFENNNINFIFVDNWKHLYDADEGNLYTDADTNINFALEPTDGGYYVINKNATTTSTLNQKLYINSSDGNRVKPSSSNATVWVLEDATTTAHKTQMQAVKDAQAAAAATAAGINSAFSVSTQATMDTYLSSENSQSITVASVSTSEAYKKDAGESVGVGYSVYTNTINDLTPGLYKLTVKAFERITGKDDTWNSGGNAGLTYLYAGDQKVQLWSVFEFPADATYSGATEKGGKYYPNDLTSAGTAFDAGKYVNEVYVWLGGTSLTYGITILNNHGGWEETNGRNNWIAYKDFTLTYYPNTPFTISENTSYDSSLSGTANVTLARTIKADIWNTFCVPFTISNDELKTAFGDGVEVAEYSSAANSDGVRTDITFAKMGTPEVSANTPVLLKTSTAGTTYSFTGRTIVAGTPQVTGDHGFDFVGSYEDKYYIPTGDYIISANTLYKNESGSYIRGTRAYIHAQSTSARMGNFYLDDEELTNIDGININTQTGKLYNLQGQEVQNPQKGGIYIQRSANGRLQGKKFIVK